MVNGWHTVAPLLVLGALTMNAAQVVVAEADPNGASANVIFLHPDGAGVNHWGALRMLEGGPDGQLEWDRLPALGVYTGHMRDALTATSHGGATVHAYGVKVLADSFGMDGTDPVTAALGRPMSIAEEAMAAGKAVGLVQTGHIAEPGTAAFVASVPSRGMREEIAAQVLASGAQVIMAGGEGLLRPEGADGRHGSGQRKDGRDLIAEAKAAGYTVVFTRDELLALELDAVDRLLGVFAHGATFNAQSEERNRAEGKDHYVAGAPTVAEMTEVALQLLQTDPDGFLAVIEEEGTDNMGNRNNAPGTLAALRRADAAVGVAHRFVGEHPDTLLLMAADSDAGGMQVIGPAPHYVKLEPGTPVPAQARNGAPLDGIEGSETPPFVAAADRFGNRLPFVIAWTSYADVSGGILVRAAGRNHDQVRPLMDNTDVYRLMYRTLFGVSPEAVRAAAGGDATPAMP